jgi:hypothetical protein
LLTRLVSRGNVLESTAIDGKYETAMTFEIWSEGPSATSGTAAVLLGTQDAEAFHAACQKLFGASECYDATRRTYWSCGLYDNETEARKAFG